MYALARINNNFTNTGFKFPYKYRGRIRRSDEFDKQLNGNYIRIVKEKNIRNNNSHIRVLTSISDMNKIITDLYLNGRKLQPHLHVLTESIKELHNSKFRKYKDKKII